MRGAIYFQARRAPGRLQVRSQLMQVCERNRRKGIVLPVFVLNRPYFEAFLLCLWSLCFAGIADAGQAVACGALFGGFLFVFRQTGKTKNRSNGLGQHPVWEQGSISGYPLFRFACPVLFPSTSLLFFLLRHRLVSLVSLAVPLSVNGLPPNAQLKSTLCFARF